MKRIKALNPRRVEKGEERKRKEKEKKGKGEEGVIDSFIYMYISM